VESSARRTAHPCPLLSLRFLSLSLSRARARSSRFSRVLVRAGFFVLGGRTSGIPLVAPVDAICPYQKVFLAFLSRGFPVTEFSSSCGLSEHFVASIPANFLTAGGSNPSVLSTGFSEGRFGEFRWGFLCPGRASPGVAMAPAPAPAPSVGVEDEGAREQNNTAVAKSEDVSMGDVKDDGSLPVPSSKPAGAPEVAPEHVEDKGGDTTECSSSFGDTFSRFDDEADGGEPEVNSQVPGPADGDLASMLPR
jgi:hypothetical protein